MTDFRHDYESIFGFRWTEREIENFSRIAAKRDEEIASGVRIPLKTRLTYMTAQKERRLREAEEEEK